MADPAPLPGIVASLRGGWRLMRDDPFGVLLPTGGMLLVDSALAAVLRPQLSAPPASFVAVAVGLFALRPFLHAPFTSRIVAVSARLRGREAWPMGRPVALLGAELVLSPLVALVWLAAAAAGVALAGLVANEGWIGSAAAVLAAALLLGALASLIVRAVFATVPWGVAVEGYSSVHALAAAVRSAPRDAFTAFVLLAVGDLLVAASAVACGALVLPGYPLSMLALSWRLSDRAEVPT